MAMYDYCKKKQAYDRYKVDYDEAVEELERCDEAIAYYNEWSGKIGASLSVINSMINQNRLIATYCQKVIVNGSTIDSGGHFNGQGAEYYSSGLKKISDSLTSLADAIGNVLTELNTSHHDATIAKNDAKSGMDANSGWPCHHCQGCLAAETPTTTQTPQTPVVVMPGSKRRNYNKRALIQAE